MKILVKKIKLYLMDEIFNFQTLFSSCARFSSQQGIMELSNFHIKIFKYSQK